MAIFDLATKKRNKTKRRRIDLKERRTTPEVKKSGVQLLSQPQISVLLLGVDLKLSRSLMGWYYDDRIRSEDPVRIYSRATIQSLHERGLLDANFSDPRILRGVVGVQNLDGARHEHSPEVPKFQVWTSALGRKVLKDKGLLLDDSELRYH